MLFAVSIIFPLFSAQIPATSIFELSALIFAVIVPSVLQVWIIPEFFADIVPINTFVFSMFSSTEIVTVTFKFIILPLLLPNTPTNTLFSAPWAIFTE